MFAVFFIIFYFLLKFRMWLKYGLKAQKLLAQGIALGVYGRKAFALTGRLADCHYTQGDALG